MPINFFDGACKTESNKIEFGICDGPHLSKIPAFIDDSNLSEWIGKVTNPSNKDVDFYAIDNCVEILKADEVSQESSCDGMLHFYNCIVFVELKKRGGSGWLKKAREQLSITIKKFTVDYDLLDFEKVEAYACNGLKPFANKGNNIELQKFKDDTGLIMYAQQDIEL